MRWRSAVVAMLLAGVACSGGAEPAPGGGAAPSPSATPSFVPAKVLIDTDEGSVLFDVEVAQTPEQRSLGLMHRTELAEDAGMVFLFFGPYTGGFWMKNTLIPLSIAFFDGEGRIIEIMDMEPCETETCPLYEPGVPYEGALEVNRGAFERTGVEPGDRITITY